MGTSLKRQQNINIFLIFIGLTTQKVYPFSPILSRVTFSSNVFSSLNIDRGDSGILTSNILCASNAVDAEILDNDDSENDAKPPEDVIEDESVENSSKNSKSDETSHAPGEWEELHGNYILRTPDPSQPPRALIHFLGGALVGAAPDIAYRYILERLSAQGYLIVATPYNLSFDYLTTCDTILDKFERIAPMLARQYGAVPVVGVGHSCGALLHLLITTLFPDTPRAANALISYNNKEVKDAVPLFEELVSPFFQYVASNETKTSGVQIIQQINHITKMTLDGMYPCNKIVCC